MRQKTSPRLLAMGSWRVQRPRDWTPQRACVTRVVKWRVSRIKRPSDEFLAHSLADFRFYQRCSFVRRATSPPHVIKSHISARAVKHLRGPRRTLGAQFLTKDGFVWCAQPVSAHLRQVLSS